MKNIDTTVSILFGKKEQEKTGNPLFTEVKVHVLYAGLNRNGTYISKSLAEKLGSNLGYTPVIGEYIKNKGDFGSHGGKITISSEGMEFEKTTVPYGVVNADKGYWWEEVEGPDGVVRNFLTVSAYLWTARYPEVERIATGSNWQSMELNRDLSVGEWITRKDGSEYFKFKDSAIEALCILGNDVEPCFEGASFKPVSEFGLLDFKAQMEQMMNEFKNYALEKEENGNMEDLLIEDAVTPGLDNELDNPEVIDTVEEVIETETEAEVIEEPAAEFEAEESEVIESEVDVETPETEFESTSDEGIEGENEGSVIEEITNEYTDKIASLEAKVADLEEKLSVYQAKEDNEKKLVMVDKYSAALGDEIIKGFRDKIDSFSVEGLKAALAEALSEKVLGSQEVTTFSLGADLNKINQETATAKIPAWVAALRNK